MLQWFKRKTNQPVDKTDNHALTREVAGVGSDLWAQTDGYLGAVPNRDPLLASRQPDAAYAYPYGLFEEALDKDAHLSALITQRKAAVLSWQRQVVPADASPEAALVAQVVEAALGRIGQGPGFERDLCELLDAIPYGIAVSEVMWEDAVLPAACAPGGLRCAETSVLKPRPSGSGGPRADGEKEEEEPVTNQRSLEGYACLLPTALRSRHPRRFSFGTQGELRLLTPAEPFAGEEAPPRKFLVFAPYGRHEDPYGLPALRSVWWLAYFKRQVLRFWVLFCEKFGTPTAVLKYPLGASEREKAAYRRIIGSIQQETGLVVPEGVELSLLEAARSGTVQTYSELLHFCNEEMSKALLGQTLSTEATTRGARSLGEVHLQVREDIVRQDAQALMALLNGQLVRWIVDLNFPPGGRLYPRWQLTPPRQDDLELQLRIDDYFARQGLGQDAAELYARYGRRSS